MDRPKFYDDRDILLARQLDDTKAMTLSRPRLVRKAGKVSAEELADALARAAVQAASLRALPPRRRKVLRNALHLFVRATEARDWPSALLFYSAAADEIATLAPRKTVISRSDRRAIAAASEALFGADDARHRRVMDLLKSANDRSFRQKLADVADSCGIRLTDSTLRSVDDLYAMRNQFAHAGYLPPSNIFYLFTTVLSVLDQLLSRLLARTGREAG